MSLNKRINVFKKFEDYLRFGIDDFQNVRITSDINRFR